MRGWEKTNFYFTWLSSPSIRRTNLYNRTVFSNLKRALGIVVEAFTPSREGRGTKVLVFKASLMNIVNYVKTLSQKRHQKKKKQPQQNKLCDGAASTELFPFFVSLLTEWFPQIWNLDHPSILASRESFLVLIETISDVCTVQTTPDCIFKVSCSHRNSYEIRNTV